MWFARKILLSSVLVCICYASGEDPVFAETTYQVSVNETFVEGGILRPNAGFLTVSCNHSSNTELMYTLVVEENIPFTIDLMTGALSVTQDLDYETTTQYNFTAVCTVATSLNLTDATTIIISLLPVNEFRPSITPRVITVRIDEFSTPGPLMSTLPGVMFTVTDMDQPPDTISYTLRHGIYEGLVYNESLNGIVLLDTYDKENQSDSVNCQLPQFEFRVAVCDTYPPEDTCPNIVLRVIFSSSNDNNPMFMQDQYSTVVPESMAINTTLLTVTCTDQDICVGEIDGMEITGSAGNFSIDEMGNIANTQLLDYELAQTYTLTVRCFDSGQREAFTTVEIQLTDVNDNPPRCSSSMVAADLEVGSHEQTRVLRLSCADDDEGMNSQLSFRAEGNLPQVPGGQFTLDQNTGELYFSGEFKSDSSFDFVVVVSDSGLPQQSTRVQVNVRVTGERMLPMLIIIVVCAVGGSLLLCCVLLLVLCCCCCCVRHSKTKKVTLYNVNDIKEVVPVKENRLALSFSPGSFDGEREVSLYIGDEGEATSNSGQSTPNSIASHSLVTGDQVICNTVVVVAEKDPLGLVEAVSQQLERQGDWDESREEQALQGTHLNQDVAALNTAGGTELLELQDRQGEKQPQGTHLNQESAAVSMVKGTELQDTDITQTLQKTTQLSDTIGPHQQSIPMDDIM